MNKAGLIVKVADETGMDRKDADVAVNAVLDIIQNSLIEGERIQLTGFGVFEVRDRKPRLGRNPRDPVETIKIPASVAPVFRAGKGFKQAVKEAAKLRG